MQDQCRPGLPVIEHVRLLLELHRLIAAGKGDDAEADEIRDAMDATWYQLHENEIEAINGLSADLYSIGQDRSADAMPAPELINELQRRIGSGKWHGVLGFIREHESVFAPKRVAILRGLAWANIQFFEPAIVFLQEAMRLSHRDTDARLLLLSCLVQAGRSEEAIRVAAESTDQTTLELASSI